MIFYHYTSAHGLNGISETKKILKGQGVLVNGSKVNPALGVNLTTSPSCIGHGLHLGQSIALGSDLYKKMPANVWVQKGLNCVKLVDHSQVRLEIKLERNDPLAQSAADYYSSNPAILRRLAFTGHNPLMPYLGQGEIDGYRAAFEIGALKDMSATWYYYFGEIPIECIRSVSICSAFNVYRGSMKFSEWLEVRNKEVGI
ncbi:MAG: hypothetical protein RLY95_16 [Pseudomonadota bacterium]|jgi:hypothetical protein